MKYFNTIIDIAVSLTLLLVSYDNLKDAYYLGFKNEHFFAHAVCGLLFLALGCSTADKAIK